MMVANIVPPKFFFSDQFLSQDLDVIANKKTIWGQNRRQNPRELEAPGRNVKTQRKSTNPPTHIIKNYNVF